MLEHIERLQTWRALDLPAGIERQVHRNRLLKIVREGGQMTSADLMKLEPQRRYATLVALAVEGTATVTDEVIELHDRILGKLFNAANEVSCTALPSCRNVGSSNDPSHGWVNGEGSARTVNVSSTPACKWSTSPSSSS